MRGKTTVPCLHYQILQIPTIIEDLNVSETFDPDEGSSGSLCKAGPSTEAPHVAEECGVDRM